MDDCKKLVVLEAYWVKSSNQGVSYDHGCSTNQGFNKALLWISTPSCIFIGMLNSHDTNC